MDTYWGMPSNDHPTSPTRRDLLALAAAGAASLALPGLATAEESASRVQTMPSIYVGHGSPMLALDAKRGAEFRAWAKRIGRPVAVLCVSAHFEKRPTTIGATTRLPLIYDFRGFPRELYRVQYGPPGAPRLARRVRAVLSGVERVAEAPRRGHDHGTWVPLKWMYPQADVPVLSVSLPTHDPKRLVAIGQRLGALRQEGVLVMGSGSLTHNLRRMDRRAGAPTASWAKEFDVWAQERLDAYDVDALIDWEKKAPAARMNHPTVEHFVPLLLALGARHRKDAVRYPITGFELANLSRRSVQFG